MIARGKRCRLSADYACAPVILPVPPLTSIVEPAKRHCPNHTISSAPPTTPPRRSFPRKCKQAPPPSPRSLTTWSSAHHAPSTLATTPATVSVSTSCHAGAGQGVFALAHLHIQTRSWRNNVLCRHVVQRLTYTEATQQPSYASNYVVC